MVVLTVVVVVVIVVVVFEMVFAFVLLVDAKSVDVLFDVVVMFVIGCYLCTRACNVCRVGGCARRACILCNDTGSTYHVIGTGHCLVTKCWKGRASCC